jgi:type IV pilus assembly protein PilO
MAAKPAAAGGSALERLPPIAKVGLGALFAALFALVYFVIFYSDLDSQISQSKARESQLHDQLAQAETSKKEYQKDQDEKTQREQFAREQKKILPDDPEMPAFLSALQGVATITGVNLTSWSPTEESPQEFFAKVPMKLTMSGKFHQVVKFFHAVGQLDRIINVENINIKNPKAQGDEVSIEVECLATAFRSSRPGEGDKGRKRGGGN